MAQYLRRKAQVDRGAQDVLIGPGSKELMFILQLVYYGDLVIPTPAWVSYAPQARIIGRNVVMLPTDAANNWQITPGQLDALCQEDPGKPRLLILNYPSNPTGRTYNATELEALATVARRHRIILLSDEIYGETHHHGEHLSISRWYPEGTIVSSGLSKWCGAGGWRRGTFTFPQQLRWLLQAMASVASETYTSTSAPIQYAAVRAFEGGTEIEHYLWQSRRILAALGQWIAAQLNAAGVRTLAPAGGFYLFKHEYVIVFQKPAAPVDVRQEVHKVREMLPWGRMQDDEWDRLSRYVYRTETLAALRRQTRRVVAEEGLPLNDFAAYVLRRWYNFTTHNVALDVIGNWVSKILPRKALGNRPVQPNQIAYEHDGIRPDIVIIGKALSGGMYPVSAILADDEVMGVFRPGDHGSTYGGNPLVCAAALAVIETVRSEDLCANALAMGQVIRDALLADEAGNLAWPVAGGEGVGDGLDRGDFLARQIDGPRERGLLLPTRAARWTWDPSFRSRARPVVGPARADHTELMALLALGDGVVLGGAARAGRPASPRGSGSARRAAWRSPCGPPAPARPAPHRPWPRPAARIHFRPPPGRRRIPCGRPAICVRLSCRVCRKPFFTSLIRDCLEG